jgi:uncharacterized protein YkwD
MNWVDVLLIIVILLAALSGFKRGFILGSLELLSWAVSLLAAFYFYPYMAAFIERYTTKLGVWTMPLSFLFILILTRIIASLFVGSILRSTAREAHLSYTNKTLGLIPGLVNGAIYAIIISGLLLILPLTDGISAKAKESQLANRFGEQVAWLDEKLSPVFDEALNKNMTRTTIQSNQTLKLSYTVDDAKPRPDLEKRMLQLVNEERTKNGLQALAWDSTLVPVSRAHSNDMFKRGYFSHITPEGKTPADRVRASGIRYLITGENLALGPTLSICHTGLMNSPGHRANILHKSYARMGIGVMDGGLRGLMITQTFKN